MATNILGVIFHNLARFHNGFDLPRRNHPIGARHLPYRVREKQEPPSRCGSHLLKNVIHHEGPISSESVRLRLAT